MWRVISPSRVWQSVDAVTQATCSSVRGCSQRNGEETRGDDSALGAVSLLFGTGLKPKE